MSKEPVKTWSTPVTVEGKRNIPCTICGGTLFKPSLSCEGFSYVRCSSCGLVQMNPQPMPEEVKKRYNAGFDTRNAQALQKASPGFGEDYLAYELANEDAFLKLQLLALEDSGFTSIEREIFDRAHSLAHHSDESSSSFFAKPKVLDIGCATGSLLALLRERGWETTGVEISRPQAEYGRLKRNLDIFDLPLEENNFRGNTFDALMASHLIEHLNDPAQMIREARRILVPGGYLFITTPNILSFQAWFFGSRWRSAIFDHLYLFSARTLSRLLREQGFTVEKIKTWGGLAAGTAPGPLKFLFDRAAKKLGFGDVMVIRAKKNGIAGRGN